MPTFSITSNILDVHKENSLQREPVCIGHRQTEAVRIRQQISQKREAVYIYHQSQRQMTARALVEWTKGTRRSIRRDGKPQKFCGCAPLPRKNTHTQTHTNYFANLNKHTMTAMTLTMSESLLMMPLSLRTTRQYETPPRLLVPRGATRTSRKKVITSI